MEFDYTELQVSESKLLDYLLNENSQDGSAKAAFFLANGISEKGFAVLEHLLKQQFCKNEPVATLASPFGLKYIFESPIIFPNGKTHLIRAVWIRENYENVIRFVTAYKISR